MVWEDIIPGWNFRYGGVISNAEYYLRESEE